jgi:hypothetical protein
MGAWLIALLWADPISAQDAAVVGVPMNREGSGTSWLPDQSLMHAVHGQRGPWDLMAHGNVFLQYLYDDGPRGHEQAGSINWIMGMARRPLGAGRLGFKVMTSLEPLTIPGCGYPDLLASGESCDGHSIVDRQHPHDLFMEAAAVYERPLTGAIGLQLYGGPVGEPALGPVAYPHRLSAMANPLAPISHHWLDATHITFGVITGGVHGRQWKAEGSLFNGREPDENRYDFDLARLDSFSGRFSLSVSPALALQVSAGRLTEAEPAHDNDAVDVDRMTASAIYHRLLGTGPGLWASTVAWGRNREAGESTSFLLLESSLRLPAGHTLFARADVGHKDAHDLGLDDPEGRLRVLKLQGGYVHDLQVSETFEAGIGVSISGSIVPEALRNAYSGRTLPGIGVFLSLRPGAMIGGADPHAGH